MSQKAIAVGTLEVPVDIDINFSNVQDNFTELYSDKATQDEAIAGKQEALTNPLVQADVDDVPVDGAIAVPVSSNWAYDHVAAIDPHHGYLQGTSLQSAIEGLAYLDLSGVAVTLDSDVALDTDITYEMLDANGDVGTGAGQLAIGDHTHSGVSDTVASGTASLGVAEIASGTSATVVTVTATGVFATDVIDWGFNGDPTGVTGYIPSTDGMLTIVAYPTAGNVNFKVINLTAAPITPGAVTINWKVRR